MGYSFPLLFSVDLCGVACACVCVSMNMVRCTSVNMAVGVGGGEVFLVRSLSNIISSLLSDYYHRLLPELGGFGSCWIYIIFSQLSIRLSLEGLSSVLLLALLGGLGCVIKGLGIRPPFRGIFVDGQLLHDRMVARPCNLLPSLVGVLGRDGPLVKW